MKVLECKAIVTGGASGIGEACVRIITEFGGKAAIFDLHEEKGKLLEKEIGQKAIFVHTDVTSDVSVKNAIGSVVKKLGGINTVINCAGISKATKVLGKEGPMSIDYFNKIIQTNLIGTMRVLTFSAEQMTKNKKNDDGEKGVIINTSSIAANQGQIGQAAYSASKGGVEGLMPPVAKELARHAIRVITIAPGIISTPMFDRIPQAARDALAKSVPFPSRLGRPTEYAQLAKHIIENSYINGEVIKITGALRMV